MFHRHPDPAWSLLPRQGYKRESQSSHNSKDNHLTLALHPHPHFCAPEAARPPFLTHTDTSDLSLFLPLPSRPPGSTLSAQPSILPCIPCAFENDRYPTRQAFQRCLSANNGRTVFPRRIFIVSHALLFIHPCTCTRLGARKGKKENGSLVIVVSDCSRPAACSLLEHLTWSRLEDHGNLRQHH